MTIGNREIMVLLLIVLTLLCLFVPLYTYLLYPLLLWVLTRKKNRITHEQVDATPLVTLIISCYNEASVIKEKLENSFSLDYPREQLNIIVVSDGSDDGTDDIVKEYANTSVQLIRQEGRLGKTMGLNLAMEQVKSDFVVFSDANTNLSQDSIMHIVRCFKDPKVGCVSGEKRIVNNVSDTAAGSGEGLYWKYESKLKKWDAFIHWS